jgi:hypothetical protein
MLWYKDISLYFSLGKGKITDLHSKRQIVVMDSIYIYINKFPLYNHHKSINTQEERKLHKTQGPNQAFHCG